LGGGEGKKKVGVFSKGLSLPRGNKGEIQLRGYHWPVLSKEGEGTEKGNFNKKKQKSHSRRKKNSNKLGASRKPSEEETHIQKRGG